MKSSINAKSISFKVNLTSRDLISGCYRGFLFGLNQLALLVLMSLPISSNADVSVTPATGGELIILNQGSSPSDWYPLTSIIIKESAGGEGDIESTGGASKEFILGFSGTGTFVFENVGAASVSVAGANIAAALDIINSATELRVQLQTTAGSLSSLNTFEISGLRVKATAAGSSNIVRVDNTPSSVDIDGNDFADAVIHASLTAQIWETPIYVGGNVIGLEGDGLVLQNNGSDDLIIGGNGQFNFVTPIYYLSPYSVTVLDQPSNPNQICKVSNGDGTTFGANINDVVVTCMTFCNENLEIGITENFSALREACEILVLGPDYVAADGSNVSANSGLEVWLMPGFIVEQGATLEAKVCGQSLCMTSDDPMPYGCHSCVDQICDDDPFCCGIEFDRICLGMVDTVCDLVCE